MDPHPSQQHAGLHSTYLGIPIVEHAEDVLSGAVDRASEQEVGEAEVVVFAGQHVVAVL